MSDELAVGANVDSVGVRSVGEVVHGVECYEAWRDETACPHEQVRPMRECGLRHTGPCPAEPYVVGYACPSHPEGPLKPTPFEDPCGKDKAVWSDGTMTDA